MGERIAVLGFPVTAFIADFEVFDIVSFQIPQ